MFVNKYRPYRRRITTAALGYTDIMQKGYSVVNKTNKYALL